MYDNPESLLISVEFSEKLNNSLKLSVKEKHLLKTLNHLGYVDFFLFNKFLLFESISSLASSLFFKLNSSLVESFNGFNFSSSFFPLNNLIKYFIGYLNKIRIIWIAIIIKGSAYTNISLPVKSSSFIEK